MADGTGAKLRQNRGILADTSRHVTYSMRVPQTVQVHIQQRSRIKTCVSFYKDYVFTIGLLHSCCYIVFHYIKYKKNYKTPNQKETPTF